MTNVSGQAGPSLPPLDGAVINPGAEARWLVVRQDDNGNRFQVQRGLPKGEAERLVAELESHGHKQLYWAEREDR